ncbi:MAG: hypothetical protein KM310_00695 [Clostridiales bacterium]|nr:hypothetical protein [Clostridiales bacterium]
MPAETVWHFLDRFREGSFVFLIGDKGVGKTALLTWVAHEQKGRAVLIRGAVTLPYEGKDILLWDDADASPSWHDEKRLRELLAPFRAGILAGRSLPSWAEAEIIRLKILSAEELQHVLEHHFPHLLRLNPTLPWYALTGGKMGWLLPLLHRMEKKGTLAPDHLLFAVESLLHPGSRRYTWRPDVRSNPLDALFFMAVILPTWDRRDALEITGWDISPSLWETFVSFPFVKDRGPWRFLPAELRDRLVPLMEREKPWLTWAWRRKALQLRQAVSDPSGGLQGEKDLLGLPSASPAGISVDHVKSLLDTWRRGRWDPGHSLIQTFRSNYPHLPQEWAKAWVLNAIEEARLFRDRPILQAILRHYYVEGRMTHEEVAARLHLSRATYFRYHREALQHLARLFTAPEEGL